MNTKIRKKAKSNFEKDFFELMTNAAFGKTIENVRKYRDNRKEKNYLVSEPNYHTEANYQKFFTENLLAIEMKKLEN